MEEVFTGMAEIPQMAPRTMMADGLVETPEMRGEAMEGAEIRL